MSIVESSQNAGGRSRPTLRTNVASGLLLGVAFAAFLDEVVFHQLLHWHHFYDRAGSAAGLVSDGLLHAFSWFAAVGAVLLVSDLRARGGLDPVRWLGAAAVGAGSFQLFDGVVDHKALRVHQIRYNVDTWPYDALWLSAGGALVLIGGTVLLSGRRGRRVGHGR